MLRDNLFPVFLCILATPVFCAGYPLNQTCSPPPSQNGLGYCGPAFCENVVNNLPGCVFTSKAQDYPAQVAKTGTKSCVQSTDPRCSSAALKALFIGQGVKAAYCNDAFLVILSDGSSGFANYLSSIKNPPASTTESGGNCVTRYTNPVFMTTKIPLFPTLLSTADRNINNKNTKSFPNGQCDRDGCYMGAKGDTYPLPTRGQQRKYRQVYSCALNDLHPLQTLRLIDNDLFRFANRQQVSMDDLNITLNIYLESHRRCRCFNRRARDIPSLQQCWLFSATKV